MPSTAGPFGLRPVFHPSGTVRQVVRPIVTAYAATINTGDPVKMSTGGYLNIGATTGAILGSFQGVQYTDSTGIPRYRNFWTTATPTYASSDATAYVTEDPSIVYEVQSTAALTIANVSEQANMSSIGSTVATGLSNAALNQATLSTSTPAQLRILELAPDINNAWGDTYTNVHVEIAQHQYVAEVNAF